MAKYSLKTKTNRIDMSMSNFLQHAKKPIPISLDSRREMRLLSVKMEPKNGSVVFLGLIASKVPFRESTTVIKRVKGEYTPCDGDQKSGILTFCWSYSF